MRSFSSTERRIGAPLFGSTRQYSWVGMQSSSSTPVSKKREPSKAISLRLDTSLVPGSGPSSCRHNFNCFKIVFLLYSTHFKSIPRSKCVESKRAMHGRSMSRCRRECKKLLKMLRTWVYDVMQIWKAFRSAEKTYNTYSCSCPVRGLLIGWPWKRH
eukprot:scaffold10050_cov117-Skeletonema_marinoi.AAC.3